MYIAISIQCAAHTVCTLCVLLYTPPQKFPEFWVALLTSLRTYYLTDLYDGRSDVHK